jgi:hypothetical protein
MLASGQLGYRMNRGKRELAVSPQEKEQLVERVAKEYYPKLLALSGQTVRSDGFFKDNPQYWQEQLLGFPVAADKTKSPEMVGLQEGSPVHAAITNALDKYDPSMGGFGGYLAGKNGALYWALQRQAHNLRASVKSPTSPTPVSPGQARGGGAPKAPPAPANTGAQEMAATVDHWREAQESMLRQLEQESPEASGFVASALSALPRIQDVNMLDMFAEVMDKHGYGKHVVDFGKSLESVALAFMAEEVRP